MYCGFGRVLMVVLQICGLNAPMLMICVFVVDLTYALLLCRFLAVLSVDLLII